MIVRFNLSKLFNSTLNLYQKKCLNIPQGPDQFNLAWNGYIFRKKILSPVGCDQTFLVKPDRIVKYTLIISIEFSLFCTHSTILFEININFSWKCWSRTPIYISLNTSKDQINKFISRLLSVFLFTQPKIHYAYLPPREWW